MRMCLYQQRRTGKNGKRSLTLCNESSRVDSMMEIGINQSMIQFRESSRYHLTDLYIQVQNILARVIKGSESSGCAQDMECEEYFQLRLLHA